MATSAQIRQQLVTACQHDLISPTPEPSHRIGERLPQPPSTWDTTGFLVPNAFQEETSNDAAIRQERAEDDDDANDSPRDTTSKRKPAAGSLPF